MAATLRAPVFFAAPAALAGAVLTGACSAGACFAAREFLADFPLLAVATISARSHDFAG
ncbi:hypothetical protein [Streptomyces sp. NBC_01190]|uniref:hypothetical protein n=1 Tax=Streptomyces sp. NBC_01190 TaxID=2903767 RepID=UPI0038690C86|nr:hypothetical protein OG519_07770 [Streptomyces sp. NBC_01190]